MSRHANLSKLLRKYGVDFIVEAFRALEGKPAGLLRDVTHFRTNVVDAAWRAAPLQIRLTNPQQLAWEDFISGLREMAFDTKNNLIALRPGFEKELREMVERTPAPRAGGGSGGGSSSANANPAGNAASRPASAASSSTVDPKAAPAPSPAGSADRTSAAPDHSPHVAPARVVGIDLGTTYSVVAFVNDAHVPEAILNADGDAVTPSVVFFDEGVVAVGKAALAAAPTTPDSVVECVKREMGSKHFPRPICGELLPPEVISSFILRSLKSDAERRLGAISQAVITVPAYFDESRRRATMDAGRIAGWDVVDIINEPTAAAIAYGYQSGYLNRQIEPSRDKPMRVMVYDLGGGTFDVSIVQIEPSSFRTLVTDGDVRLGGKDWDEQIVEFVAEKFRDITGEDPHDSTESLERLWQAAERGKRQLSENPKTFIEVAHRGHRRPIEVTRWDFERLTSALLERTLTTAEIVLMQSGLSWQELDRVLLVGGSSRMPMVRRALRDLTGAEPDDTVGADEAVAKGAAIFAQVAVRRREEGIEPLPVEDAQPAPPAATKPAPSSAAGAASGVGPTNASIAAKFTQVSPDLVVDRSAVMPLPSLPSIEPMSVSDVNSHSLGVLAVDPLTKRKTNVVIIPKNTPLPATAKRRFRTAKANQPNVQVRVLEGESEDPDACQEVGLCAIRGLPANLPAGSPVEVGFTYQSNGRLRVSATLVGHAAGVKVDFARVNSLENDDLAMWAECVQATRSATAVFRDAPVR